MKRIVAIASVCSIICYVHSAAQKGRNKVIYEFPAAMAEDVRADFAKQCDKGYVLYELNCGGCHTTTVKGKKIIPDFSEAQMEAYQIRVLNPKHEEELPETSVTSEELSLISTFFTYKKKNKE